MNSLEKRSNLEHCLTSKRCRKNGATCNCNLSALIEELAKRPLTWGSLPHCARGQRGLADHLGKESCAENGLMSGWPVVLILIGNTTAI